MTKKTTFEPEVEGNDPGEAIRDHNTHLLLTAWARLRLARRLEAENQGQAEKPEPSDETP